MGRVVALLFCVLLCCGFSRGRAPQTYYVSNSGNDSNNGLTPATPWATPGKVNSSSFNSGDTVAFDGGSTFSTGLNITHANTPGYLTLTSFNAGKPTFNTGTTGSCVLVTNVSGVTINNFNCVGSGNTTNNTYGIYVSNSEGGYTILLDENITNSTVAGYGLSCIAVEGTVGATVNGTVVGGGFGNVTINSNTAHDCAADFTDNNMAPGSGTACFSFRGVNRFDSSFSGANNLSFNWTVSNNTAYNCLGKTNTNSGYGIAANGITNLLIANNLVHDSGSGSTTCGGPAGIIVLASALATVQFNEVYNISNPGGCDGEAIDFDTNVSNSTMQYNYTHNNQDSELIIGNFVGPGAETNDTIRFNITEAGSSSSNLFSECNVGGGCIGLNYFNNTMYPGNPGAAIICFNGKTASKVAFVNISNNICARPGSAIAPIYLDTGANANFTITGNDYYGSSVEFTVNNGSTFFNSLAAFQAAGFEKVGGNPVGTTANPNLTNPGSGGTCGGYNGTCPTAYDLTASSPAGKGNGLNLNSDYGFTVGTQDFYGNVLTAGSLPIGAAANK